MLELGQLKCVKKIFKNTGFYCLIEHVLVFEETELFGIVAHIIVLDLFATTRKTFARVP
jgi:hypothetical protein